MNLFENFPPSPKDFLRAGIELEREGQKCLRDSIDNAYLFFTETVEMYKLGSNTFPSSFDLAYSWAGAEYRITQNPRLLAMTQELELDAPLLNTCVGHYVKALELQPFNTDAICNAAQALTSLAASVLEAGLPRMHNYVGPDGGSDSDIVFLNDDDFDDSVEEIVYHDTSRTPPPMLFDQAVILYQRCLAYQKARYIEGKEAEKERQRGLANCMVAPSSGPLEIHNYTRIGKSMARPTMDRWALREERVTEDTLLDTSIAHMKALVALCTSLAEEDVPSINLRWLEGGTACKLLSLMRARAEDTGRQLEVAPLLLAFTSAFAYYSYRSGDLNLLLYEKKIQEVISNPLLEFAGSQQLLLAKARALLLFVQSASGHELLEQHDEKCTQEQLDVMQWKYLTEAIESLNAASKMPTSKLSASIHLLRGDVELRRYAFLSSAVTLSIGKCGPRIVQNAETYFRGSAALAARHDDRKVAQEASVKEAIASWLLGSNERMVDCLVEFKARRLILKLVRDCEEKGILNAFRAAKLKKYIRAMQNKLDAMEG